MAENSGTPTRTWDMHWSDWSVVDPYELEPFYSKWVGLLTSEGLHAKADIATVLALFDRHVCQLERELAEQEERIRRLWKMVDANEKAAERAEAQAAQSATQPTAGVELLREWQTLYKEIFANFLPQARTTQGGLAARTDEFLAAVGGKSDGSQV